MRVWRALERRAWTVRQLAAARARPVSCNLVGPQLWRWGEGSGPRVLMVPGGLDGVAALAGPGAVAPAPWLARRGWVVYGFCPSGREHVPGDEDFNGPRHQQELLGVLEELADERPVLLSLSFGLVCASGALARAPSLAARLPGLVDWEGPPSRRWFEAARIGAPPTDEAFWGSREAVRWLPALRCPYVRLQSRWDHVHGAEVSLADEAVDAALTGGVRAWFNRESQPGPRPLAPQGLGAMSALALDRLTALVRR